MSTTKESIAFARPPIRSDRRREDCRDASFDRFRKGDLSIPAGFRDSMRESYRRILGICKSEKTSIERDAMKRALSATIAALVVMTSLAGVAQTKKSQRGPALSQQSPPAPDPLSSFRQIVKRFNTFFAAGPQKLIWQLNEGSSPKFAILEFRGQDIAYDVQQTNSLVSPYSAVINMNVVGKSNQSCGDIRSPYTSSAIGWSTVNGALSSVDRSECYKNWPLEKEPTVYSVRFTFAFQDGRWVFTDAIDAQRGDKFELFLSIFGNANYPPVVTRFSEPEAQQLNAAWRDLEQQ